MSVEDAPFGTYCALASTTRSQLTAGDSILMFEPAVMAVGVGASGRADGEAPIVVYVNKDAGNRPFLPIEGIPVTVILTDQFIAR